MTRNLTNYHSHCSLCDGRAPMEDFVREAVRRGFTSYGISSHAPLPFPAVWTLDRGDVTTYLSEIERLKRSYAGRIELYAGMEIDYLDECDNPASDYFRQLPLDYRIGSVHLMHADDGGIVDIDTSPERFAEMLSGRFGGDLRRLTTAYFDKLIRMVRFRGSRRQNILQRRTLRTGDHLPRLVQGQSKGVFRADRRPRAAGRDQYEKI